MIMAPKTVYHMVADVTDPKAEPYMVLRVDTLARRGDGCEGTVISLHWFREEAELRARELEGELPQ